MVRVDIEPTFIVLKREMISPGFFRYKIGSNGFNQGRPELGNQKATSPSNPEMSSQRFPQNAAGVGSKR